MDARPDAYVLARHVLLDALDALGPHRDAMVLVGAQAIYLHTGAADLAIAPFTIDADLVVDRTVIADRPLLEEVMAQAGFERGGSGEVGRWRKEGIPVDLMVPSALAGPGRRGVDLGPHDRTAARRATGLEAALEDNAPHPIRSLEPGDGRSFMIAVAGPTALLVAKIHKISERLDDPGRERDKDALDVLRLLRAIDTEVLASKIRILRTSATAGSVTEVAIGQFAVLFTEERGKGVEMAVRAAASEEDPEEISMSMVVLGRRLLDSI